MPSNGTRVHARARPLAVNALHPERQVTRTGPDELSWPGLLVLDMRFDEAAHIWPLARSESTNHFAILPLYLAAYLILHESGGGPTPAFRAWISNIRGVSGLMVIPRLSLVTAVFGDIPEYSLATNACRRRHAAPLAPGRRHAKRVAKAIPSSLQHTGVF